MPQDGNRRHCHVVKASESFASDTLPSRFSCIALFSIARSNDCGASQQSSLASHDTLPSFFADSLAESLFNGLLAISDSRIYNDHLFAVTAVRSWMGPFLVR